MPAASVKRYYRFFLHQQARKVLDYGAGTLRNARFLAEEGFEVIAADLPEQIEKIRGGTVAARLAGLMEAAELEQSRLNVDLVISNFVFNIIPDGAEKQQYLSNVARNLRDEGYLLIEVRCRQNEVPCGSNCIYYLKCSRCIKTYSHQELDLLVIPYGFRRISHYYQHRALTVLYQLDGH